MGNSTATIDGSEIIVEVEVVGGEKKATAEIILSNDLFLRLSASPRFRRRSVRRYR